MPQIRLIIDGDTRFDFHLDPNAWQQKPPQELAELMTPEARATPYSMAALAAIIDAITMGTPTDPEGWSLSVRRSAATGTDITIATKL